MLWPEITESGVNGIDNALCSLDHNEPYTKWQMLRLSHFLTDFFLVRFIFARKLTFSTMKFGRRLLPLILFQREIIFLDLSWRKFWKPEKNNLAKRRRRSYNRLNSDSFPPPSESLSCSLTFANDTRFDEQPKYFQAATTIPVRQEQHLKMAKRHGKFIEFFAVYFSTIRLC